MRAAGRAAEGDPIRDLLEVWPVIPAVRDPRDLERSLAARGRVVYLLCGNVGTVGELVAPIRAAGKAAIVNLDLLGGLSKDPTAVAFLAACGVSGIISTHHETLRATRANGLLVVQRSFLLDSQAMANAVRALERFRPDAVELLPAPAAPRAIERIERTCPGLPLIAGGLVASLHEIDDLLRAGIAGVSVSDAALWSS